MKAKFIPAMCLFFSCAFSSHAVIFTVQGPIVNPANGHSYYLTSPGTWQDGEAYAQSLGGHLVTINDPAEDAWVYANFLVPDPNRNPYMGLNDADENGTWTWISGEPVNYLNWAPGEPNFPWEFYGNYFQVNSSYPGKWNNTIPTDPLNSIVEVVPEPTSLSLLVLTALGLRWTRRARTRV